MGVFRWVLPAASADPLRGWRAKQKARRGEQRYEYSKNRQHRNSLEFDAAIGFLESSFPQLRSIARSRGEKAGF